MGLGCGGLGCGALGRGGREWGLCGTQRGSGAAEPRDVLRDLAGSEDGAGIGIRPAADAREEAADLVEGIAELVAVPGGRLAADGQDEEVENVRQMEAAALERADDFGEIGAEAGILREARGKIDEVFPVACGRCMQATDGSDLLDFVCGRVHGWGIFEDRWCSHAAVLDARGGYR